MSGGETWEYTLRITLSTNTGELPSDEEVERLVADQMSGELDERTGLAALAVILVKPDEEES